MKPTSCTGLIFIIFNPVRLDYILLIGILINVIIKDNVGSGVRHVAYYYYYTSNIIIIIFRINKCDTGGRTKFERYRKRETD